MAKLPAFQFYPGDWMKNAELRRCSPAARGVWLDLLCLMFECEERGVLASAHSPWTDDEVAVAVAGDTQNVLSCLRELLAKGVARRNASGAIFSRRMVHDEKTRQQNRTRQSKHRNGESNGHITHLVTPPSQLSSSSSSSSKPPAAPQPFNGQEAAGFVLAELMISGVNLRQDIAAVIDAEMEATGKPAETVAEQMVEAFHRYQATSEGTGRYALGPRTFFAEGKWREYRQAEQRRSTLDEQVREELGAEHV